MNATTLRSLLAVVVLAIALLAFGWAQPGVVGAWLAPGPIYQYPVEGGTWKYGFWDAYVRSYYLHPSLCHGSTVILNGRMTRSANTAPDYWSNAARFAIQSPDYVEEYYYRTC